METLHVVFKLRHGTAHTAAQHRVLSACERSTGMPHSRLATIACGVGLLGSTSAWLPCGVTTATRAVAGARAHRGEGRQSAALTPLKSSTRDGVERPDLAALKKGFEQSMDGKLVMEYVTVCYISRCRCRRAFRFCVVLIQQCRDFACLRSKSTRVVICPKM